MEIKKELHEFEWDGKDYFPMLKEVLRVPEWQSALFRDWLIGMVAKATMGFPPNTTLLLGGPPRTGKSTFLKWLSWGGAFNNYFDSKDKKAILKVLCKTQIVEYWHSTRPIDLHPLNCVTETKFGKPLGSLVLVCNHSFIPKKLRTTDYLHLEHPANLSFLEIDNRQVWAQVFHQYLRKLAAVEVVVRPDGH